MTDRAIRVVALGVVRREGSETERGTGEELLVETDTDPDSGKRSYRPLGGGVEFGEHSEDALHREFREELGVELTDVSYLETYEDVFTDRGKTLHEVWRLYEAEIVEDWPYEQAEFTAYEPELDEDIECVWKSRTALETEETFYPEALLTDL